MCPCNCFLTFCGGNVDIEFLFYSTALSTVLTERNQLKKDDHSLGSDEH